MAQKGIDDFLESFLENDLGDLDELENIRKKEKKSTGYEKKKSIIR